MKKKCNKCSRELSTDRFHKNASNSDGLQRECKDCKKQTDSTFYQKNKEKYSKRARNRRKNQYKQTKQKIVEYLTNRECADCGNSDIRVLTFDHIQDKKHNVTSMMHGGYTWKSIKKEIDKCEIRCANCHFIRHWPDRFQH